MLAMLPLVEHQYLECWKMLTTLGLYTLFSITLQNLQSTHKCGILQLSQKHQYICKYVTKGSDAAMFAVANEMPNRLDEVTTYQQG
ncbi:hypothetical protein TNCT_285501 [Trichonephila clavata]|uniref:Uncharacterized protein n=1 Tax=Trichonephila clavata TaxID=2740835 RepID=A0A8X6KRZ8_TRICU|nr:hypothetical protein TNCT_285501 [Trichonephila clavata]